LEVRRLWCPRQAGSGYISGNIFVRPTFKPHEADHHFRNI
jgi:hypothetical protein